MVCGVLIGIGASVDLGKYLAEFDGPQGCQFLDAGRGGEHVLVVFECLRDEVLQYGIGIDGPPLHVGYREGVGERRGGVDAFGERHLGSGIFFPDLARCYCGECECAEQKGDVSGLFQERFTLSVFFV